MLFHFSFFFLAAGRVSPLLEMSSSRRICTVCDQSVDISNYARHVKSHSITFQCKHCPLVNFKRRDSFLRHLKLHDEHYKTDDKPTSNTIIRNIAESIDEDALKFNIMNFHVSDPGYPSINAIDFVPPFSCKIVGPRGSGKTSFTVSYIQQVANLKFKKIFIVTMSPDQDLYIPLKEVNKIFFITIDELEAAVESNRHSLIVLDDVMQEAHYNPTIQSLFTRGRHLQVSVMSLEQDMAYSNYVERRNVDYYVVTRMRDTSCLNDFYKKFCQDIQHWRFIDLYEFAVGERLGFLIIDFISQLYKYRINSFNVYYEVSQNNLKHVVSDDNQVLKLEQLNHQLQEHFMKTISSFNSSSKSMKRSIAKPTEVNHVKSDAKRGKTDEREISSTNMVSLTKPGTQITILDGVYPTINIPKCEIYQTDERETSSTNMASLTKPNAQIAILDEVSPTINISKCEICQEDFSAAHNPKGEIVNHTYFRHKILVRGEGKLCGFCKYSSSSLDSTINHILSKHKARFQDGPDSKKLTLLPLDRSDDEYGIDDSWDDCDTYC